MNLFLYQAKYSLKKRAILNSLKYCSSALNCLIIHQKRIGNNPADNFIINHRYRFIYCPIPKVACSSFKQLAIQLSDLEDKAEAVHLPHKLMHSYVSHNLTLSSKYGLEESQTFLDDSSYFKFAFVRNPWDRLVSAYLNKFVDPLKRTGYNVPIAQEVIKDFYLKRGESPQYWKSITFNHFIEYLMDKSDADVDGHWRSQHHFLGNVDFDFIGRFESIREDCQYLSRKLQVSIDLPKNNQSDKDKSLIFTDNLVDENVCDYYPHQFLRLKNYPHYERFYTQQAREKIRLRYAEDIEKFDYDFLPR